MPSNDENTMSNTRRQILDVIERHHPRDFMVDVPNERVLSFGDFGELVAELAGAMRRQGVADGERVALLMRNSPELAALYFACMVSGVVAVPINSQLHARDISHIATHSAPRAVFYSPGMEHLLPAADSSCSPPPAIAVPSPWDPVGQVSLPPTEEKPVDVATIHFTSGTTGLPKGVAHRAASLLRNAGAFNDALGFDTESRFYHVMPMTYMAGFLNTLLCPFLAGASVVLQNPFDAQMALRFWEAAIAHEANTFWLSPTMLSILMKVDRSVAAPDYCKRNARAVCVGTAPLPLSLRQEFEERYNVTIYESYGLSETLFLTTQKPGSDWDGPVGCPLPGVEVRVVSTAGRAQPGGTEGEIHVRTPHLMAGYLAQDVPQVDHQAPGTWFATGDLGRLNGDGSVTITGRKKDLIISGGINISPVAAENVILRHESVQDAAVLGIPHPIHGEEVVAVLTLRSPGDAADVPSQVAKLCRDELSAPVRPRRIIVMDSLPRSTTGKVQKNVLKGMLTPTENGNTP